MKTLTKEQVYVVIDNQADCDRAIQILTKAGENLWQDESGSESGLICSLYHRNFKCLPKF